VELEVLEATVEAVEAVAVVAVVEALVAVSTLPDCTAIQYCWSYLMCTTSDVLVLCRGSWSSHFPIRITGHDLLVCCGLIFDLCASVQIYYTGSYTGKYASILYT
jgi:hypothetical protein